MFILGLALITIALILLPSAWRGRIVGRGQFCRKCKFDLTGSPIDTQGNKCPECGQPIHTQSSRRTTLRRSSRFGLIASLVLLLAGISSMIIGISGNTAIIYARLPDTAIVHLSTLNSEGALDELVNRITRTPPLSDAHWNILIDHGLKIQTDPLAPWNPILGEVLADAWITNRLTDEQVNQYLDHALDIQFLMRDRLVRGSTEIKLLARITPAKIHSLNGTETGHALKIGIVSSSIGTEPSRHYRPDGKPLWISHTGISVPGSNGHWSYTSAVDIRPIAPKLMAQPGTEVPITINLELALESSSFSSTENPEGTIRHYKSMTINRFVRIIEEGTPLVDMLTDSLSVQHLKEHYTISAVRVLDEPHPDRESWTPILGFSIMTSDGFPEPLAFGVFIRIADGTENREVQIAKIIHEQKSGKGIHATTATWNADPDDPEASSQAADMLALIKTVGRVDVILRPDPTIAESNPTIDHILDTTLIFRDVSVELVDTYGQIWMTRINDPKWRTSNED